MFTQLKKLSRNLAVLSIAGGWAGQACAGWIEDLCAEHKTPAFCIAKIKTKLQVPFPSPLVTGGGGSGGSMMPLPGVNHLPPRNGMNHLPPRNGVNFEPPSRLDLPSRQDVQSTRSGNGAVAPSAGR